MSEYISTPIDEEILSPFGENLINFDNYEESYLNITTMDGDWLVTPDGVYIINFEALVNIMTTPLGEEILSPEGDYISI